MEDMLEVEGGGHRSLYSATPKMRSRTSCRVPLDPFVPVCLYPRREQRESGSPPRTSSNHGPLARPLAPLLLLLGDVRCLH